MSTGDRTATPEVASETGFPLHDVGRTFYRVGHAFHVDWLERDRESANVDPMATLGDAEERSDEERGRC